MSCNGCRVLRKGCSETCILRSCLQWIESAEAQGHATVFVAKFFGRAGLMAFISGVPENERPGVFQSLLYEACGRTVNPVYGAVGLLWSGNWNICEAAVETVLRGGTIRPLSQPTIPLLNHALPLPSKPLQSTQPASPCKRVLTENFCFASEKKSRTLGQVSVGDDRTSSYNLLNKIWTSNPDFLKDGFDNGDEEKKDEDAGWEQIVTPEKTMEANGSSRALRAIPNQIALDMELDLTLSPYLSRKKQMKADGSVSSPNSAISVNSEGSLTSLDTIDFPIFRRHFRPPPLKEKHELLNFLDLDKL